MKELMPPHDFRIKQLESFRALSLRFIAQNHLHFARVCADIRAAAGEKSVPVNRQPIQITYAAEYRENDVDTEFVLPIEDTWTERVPLAHFGTMTVREFSGMEAVTYVIGASNLDSVNAGLDDLERWIETQGYKRGDSIWMVYLKGFVTPLPVEERLFEIQHPLEKVLIIS
jgi:effector-binding domain-containing protein